MSTEHGESQTDAGKAKKQRKPRSDKGTKRDVAYMVVTAAKPSEVDPTGRDLAVLARGKTADDAFSVAAAVATPGQEVEVWRRVGKPRTAQLRFL